MQHRNSKFRKSTSWQHVTFVTIQNHCQRQHATLFPHFLPSTPQWCWLKSYYNVKPSHLLFASLRQGRKHVFCWKVWSRELPGLLQRDSQHAYLAARGGLESSEITVGCCSAGRRSTTINKTFIKNTYSQPTQNRAASKKKKKVFLLNSTQSAQPLRQLAFRKLHKLFWDCLAVGCLVSRLAKTEVLRGCKD